MALKLIYILTLIGYSALTPASNWKYNLHKGLEQYVQSGKETTQLRNALSGITFPHLFRTSYTRKERWEIGDLLCPVCNIGVDIVITARREGAPMDTVGSVIEFLCTNIVMEPDKVCNGVVEQNKDILAYIIDNNKNLTSERVCSMLLQDFKCEDPDREDWTVSIPPPLPSSNATYRKDDELKPPYKILQLTDMHYDPEYTIGSRANCLEPLCCQSGSTALRSEDQAGYWGDYRSCDLPWHSVVDVLDHVVGEHRDVDFVYFTGDIINHKVWKTNIEENKKAITKVYRRLKQTFGNLKVYPILGNHEPHPVNMFSSDIVEHNHLLSTQWLFNIAAEEWTWLPKDTEKTILKGGYYTVVHKPGFRIIALNSNVCYTLNFWLFFDDKDPFDQLQWLTDTLEEAEKNGERVHILSHVPTGDLSCLHNWGNEFVKIIYRFSHIISAQFNGHTHHDETVILFTKDKEPKPVNVAFNGGSLTPYSDLNPNYKVYEIDSATHDVIDYESWSYNLTEANADPQIPPQWKKLYSFKESYGVSDMSPAELAKLVERMAKDPKLTQRYFRFKNRQSDTSLATGCGSECEIDNICYMVTFVRSNKLQCETFTEMYNAHRPPLTHL